MISMSHKRGDSFRPAMSVQGVTSIAGWTITSQIRDGDDVLVADLEVESRDDTACTYSLKPAADFSETDWPIGSLRWDIQYTDANGQVFSTQTVVIRCEPDVTR